MRDAKQRFASFCFLGGSVMIKEEVTDILIASPVIAATDKSGWNKAVSSEAKVLFHLNAGLFGAKKDIASAKEKGKTVFVHIDLTDGIGKDQSGLLYLKKIGADGIISTRANLIKSASEIGLLTVQRFFALDSKSIHSIREMISQSHPDFVEIMPGIIPKVVKMFSSGSVPVIAGGLIEEKAEVTAALKEGAAAVSTGKDKLWSI